MRADISSVVSKVQEREKEQMPSKHGEEEGYIGSDPGPDRAPFSRARRIASSLSLFLSVSSFRRQFFPKFSRRFLLR